MADSMVARNRRSVGGVLTMTSSVAVFRPDLMQ
jgi:hypothetical protein